MNILISARLPFLVGLCLSFFTNSLTYGQTEKDTTSIDQLYNRSKRYWNTNTDSARYFLDQVKTLSEELDYRRGQAYALYGYGVLSPVLYKQFQYFTQSLTLFEELHDKFGIGLNLIKIGIIYKTIGQEEKALDYFKASLSVKKEIDDNGGIALTLIQIGQYYQQKGNPEEALRQFEQSLVYRIKEGTPQGIGYSQVNIGEVRYQQGQMDEALNLSDSALQNFLIARDISGQIWALLLKGKSLLNLGRKKEAEAMFESIGKYPATFEFMPYVVSAKKELIALYKDRGEIHEAFQLQSNYLVAMDTLARRDYRNQTQRLIQEQEFKQWQAQEQEQENFKSKIRTTVALISLSFFLLIGSILYRNNRKKQKANEILIQTLTELKSTQSQLIQSEKMASLGELTAGIAHEIQNPLNFVNNFSEVSTDLVAEMNTEIDKGNTTDAKAIASDLRQNLEKIKHHGQRAADIVKGMLQHSRSSTGQKESTDINALCDEYLRLAYHGLRAKDKSFNAKFETHLDPALPKVNVVPQDIGRVVLNLINNAFYACTERSRSAVSERLKAESQRQNADFEPMVTVSTRSLGSKIEISVKDNGSGIPDHIKEKIFQPFFTTKPTGQGTGLGLSLSYDIIKAHGGELTMETTEGLGSIFSILLPA